VGSGQLTARLDIDGTDEFAQVGAAFNTMTETVQEQIQTLNGEEGAIIEVEKLAGIGMLTAGIAHEINTPLQIITGYSNVIRRDIEAGEALEPDSLKQKIESIEHNAWRIAAIVKSLLSYARPSAEEAAPCTLNDIVEDTLLLIEHQLSTWSNIIIRKELAADLPPLPCDRNKITQVLINLLTNAADAMPAGGWITIRTGFVPETGRFFLHVADTGGGIPKHLQDRIFTPFYTTKGVGRGTGLGLSIARDIIESHGGVIRVASQPEKGTTFTILLPQEKGAETLAINPAFLKEDCTIE
jgi:signal transduction histidine kinase